MSTTPRQKSAWRARTRLKRKGKAYVDPLVGMGSKGFMKHVRSIGRKPEDEAAAKLRRRIAFTGGVVHHSKTEEEI